MSRLVEGRAAPRADAPLEWWRRPGRAWLALAALLALGTAVCTALGSAFGGAFQAAPPATLLDWQPALWIAEPWRAITAAFVHYSALHIVGNAAGLSLTAAYGWAARVPPRIALAWLVAWPLTHFGLLLQPALLHYGGLSGVVHAGVAIVTLYVILAGYRWVGGTVLAMLLVKLATESPFGPALQHASGWDIALAPIAHATGVASGLLCCAVSEALARAARRRGRSTPL